MSADASALYAAISKKSTNWLVVPTEVEAFGAAVGVARDPHGRAALLIPAPGRPAELKLMTRGLTARIGALASGEGVDFADWLMITCLDKGLNTTFFGLCDAVIGGLASIDPDSDPIAEAMAIVRRWKALLEGAADDVLGEEQCAGLIAELHAMEVLVDHHGPVAALAAWTAGDRSRVDFRFARSGLEVKATLHRDQFKVTVHGLLQMDDHEVGSLRLFAQQLERVPSGGDSLPDAVARLVDSGVDEAQLRKGLADVGCLPKDEDIYRTVLFKVLEERGVLVTEATPRIVPGSFHDEAIPEALSRVTYQVDLTALTTEQGRLDDPRAAFEDLI